MRTDGDCCFDIPAVSPCAAVKTPLCAGGSCSDRGDRYLNRSRMLSVCARCGCGLVVYNRNRIVCGCVPVCYRAVRDRMAADGKACLGVTAVAPGSAVHPPLSACRACNCDAECSCMLSVCSGCGCWLVLYNRNRIVCWFVPVCYRAVRDRMRSDRKTSFRVAVVTPCAAVNSPLCACRSCYRYR